MSAYEVDMKYGRQIQTQFFVVFPGGSRKILTSNLTLQEIQMFLIAPTSPRKQHTKIYLDETRKPGKLYHLAALREREYMQ